MTNLVNSVTKNSTALAYCTNKATPEGSNLYYATLFTQKKNKPIIIGLHAFLSELANIIQTCSDPGIARIKLHWWQEEIERLFQQEPRHPVTQYLNEYISFEQQTKLAFKSIITNFEAFIFIDPVNTLDNILSLYHATAGALWHQCALQRKASTAGNTISNLRDMGAVYQYMQCLQDPKTYITQTRYIIPENIIKRDTLLDIKSGLTMSAVDQNTIFTPLLQDLITRLEKIYTGLQVGDNLCHQHSLILNRLAYKTCEEILNDGCQLLNMSTRLTPLRKLWIAWRARVGRG